MSVIITGTEPTTDVIEVVIPPELEDAVKKEAEAKAETETETETETDSSADTPTED